MESGRVPCLNSVSLLNRYSPPSPCFNCGFQSSSPRLTSIELLNMLALTQLYNPTHVQCSSCGIRTLNMAQHLDWHFRSVSVSVSFEALKINFRSNREMKSTESRNWYTRVQDWCRSDSCTVSAVPPHQAQASKSKRLKITDTHNRNKVCSLCLENFDVVYHQASYK